MTDTVTPTLKPCPFCGGAARQPKLNDEWGVYALNCSQCHGGTGGDTADEAVDEWNTRASEATQAAEIARLREALKPFARAWLYWRDLNEVMPKSGGALVGPKGFVLGSDFEAAHKALSSQPSEQEGGE